jgi:hypothetical protein
MNTESDDFSDALEKAIRKTGVERYRYLTLEHPDEKVKRQYRALVLEIAADSDPATFPSITKQVGNAFGAMRRVVAAAVAGEPIRVSREQYVERQAACDSCPNLVNSRCRLCGCQYKLKIALASEACPDDPSRWGAVENMNAGATA